MTTPGTSKAEIDKNTYGIIDLRKGDPTYGYELSQAVEDGVLPDQIESAALNKWVFNEDTIRKALDTLMSQGIRVDYGNKLSKSIIFSYFHRHAEKILEMFSRDYPAYAGWAQVIDNQARYV